MTALASITVALLVSAAVSVGCSSNSPSATGDGGTQGTSGGSTGGCVLILDGGLTVECTVNRINGSSDTVNQAGCTPTETTYVASCPTKNLVGCCTAPANTGAGTVTQEECYYDVKEDGAEGCVACGISGMSKSGQPTYNTAAQTEAKCKATGVVTNPGTWSTTP
jgi:hypothetical protein